MKRQMGALEVYLAQAHRSRWAQKWGLSPRLARVAAHVLKGQSDKEISAFTGLSVLTVRTYVKQVLKAAGVRNRVQLVHGAFDATRAGHQAAERTAPADRRERGVAKKTRSRRRVR
jgi:DNA-binding CsgD family transcriptional regulator